MSLEQQIGALVKASENLTGAVNGKIGEIDQEVANKIKEVDQTLNNLFLDPRFGIQPSHERIDYQNIPGCSGGDIYIVPIYTFDVRNVSTFQQGSFVVDIFANGAVTSDGNWFRQLHIGYKQQNTGFTYNIKCIAQNGRAGTGVVAITYDPNGGQENVGQLKVWINSSMGYNTLEFVARGGVRRFDTDLGIDWNDRGALHFRTKEGFLADSAQHNAVKKLPNYTELDI